jgi:hypothetical protein
MIGWSSAPFGRFSLWAGRNLHSGNGVTASFGRALFGEKILTFFLATKETMTTLFS